MSELSKQVITDLDVVCTLSRKKSRQEVTLLSSQWAAITQINGYKSVGAIATILGLKEEEALSLFNELLDLGLIEVRNPVRLDDRLAPIGFFDELQKQLTRVIGQVAPFVIEDALREKAVKKGSFRLDRVPELVECISEEIAELPKRIKFQEAMLDIIKELLHG